MDNKLVRLAYAIEFMIAIVAVYTLWSQVAGQGHVDLVPWYWKLPLGLLASFASVRATIAAVSQERGWNARTLRWLALLAAMLVGCAMISYYAHLYWEEEEEDVQEESQPQSAAMGGADLAVSNCAVKRPPRP